MRNQFFTPTKWFDKILSYYRYSRVFHSIKQSHAAFNSALDLGCGSGNLVKLLNQKGIVTQGIDITAGDNIIASDLNKPLPVVSDSINLVTSLANLEHLNEPLLNLKEIYRVLKKDGVCVLTTPSTAAKPVLEFIAYKLKLIERAEIDDHKMYFSKELLSQYFLDAGFEKVQVKYFQFGLNLHAIAVK